MARILGLSRSALSVYLLFFALFLGVASSAPGRPESPEACHSCVPPEVREKIAVGINLGQPYGAAVAYHANGTATTVAKIPGSDEYKELMQRLMRSKPFPWPTLWHQLSSWGSRLLKTVARAVGFALPTQRVLADILVKLKVAADQDLNTGITEVIVSAPWLPAWEDHDAFRSDNDALFLVGMSNMFGLNEPLYMTEAQATLAANGRSLCPPFEHYTEPFEFPGDYRPPALDGVVFISLSNDSLYTAFALAKCFYQYPWERDGIIDNRYGLAKLAEYPTPEAFWAKIQSYLVDRVTKDGANRPWMPRTIEVVLVAGEAGKDADFLRVVRHVANTIPKAYKFQQSPAELVVPLDPGTAAAKGAAILSRLIMEHSYYCKTEECSEFDTDLPPKAKEKVEL